MVIVDTSICEFALTLLSRVCIKLITHDSALELTHELNGLTQEYVISRYKKY